MQVSVSGALGIVFLALLLLVPGGQAAAQIEHDYTQVKYDRGLNVQPAFEGWVRNPDGTIDLWFGYLNRNWAQRLHIPVGPDNTTPWSRAAPITASRPSSTSDDIATRSRSPSPRAGTTSTPGR